MVQVRPLPSWLKPLVIALAVAALYVVTARLGLTLAMPPEKKATAVWPPSGIALAAVLLAGYRVWPGIWLGAFLANLWDYFDPANAFSLRGHLAVSSGIAAGSALQALLGASLLHHWIGRNSPLDRARSVFQFVGIVPLICLVASTVGVTTLVLAGFTHWVDYGFHWWTWWLGDTVGILVVTPVVLSWSKPPRFTWEPRRLAEAGLLLGLLLSVALFVFGGWRPWGIVTGALAYMTVPLLVWATFRFGQRGATASLLLISIIAVWGTIHQHGPFVQKTLNESLLLLQAFVGILAVTALALAGVLAERRQAEQAKAIAIEQLEQALHEIKTLRGLIPICAWCKRIRNDAGSWEQLEAYLHEHTEAEFSHGICPECSERRLVALPQRDDNDSTA
jgi:integral membrane sensor domain MASE1